MLIVYRLNSTLPMHGAIRVGSFDHDHPQIYIVFGLVVDDVCGTTRLYSVYVHATLSRTAEANNHPVPRILA
jgi:hypothetical protein